MKNSRKEDEMRWLNTRFQRSTWWLAYWSLSRTHGTQQDSNKCMAVFGSTADKKKAVHAVVASHLATVIIENELGKASNGCYMAHHL